MGRTEERVHQLALARGIPLERGRPLPWLTKRGHLNQLLVDRAPGTAAVLAAIYGELGGDEAKLAFKTGGRDPVPDFMLSDARLIVEVDEIQHFTSDRLRALGRYPVAADLGFDINHYRALIESWCTRADVYRATKPSFDFSDPGGRRAQRAYFDTVRDLAAPTFGFRVCRIAAPECDPDLALDRLVEALAALV